MFWLLDWFNYLTELIIHRASMFLCLKGFENVVIFCIKGCKRSYLCYAIVLYLRLFVFYFKWFASFADVVNCGHMVVKSCILRRHEDFTVFFIISLFFFWLFMENLVKFIFLLGVHSFHACHTTWGCFSILTLLKWNWSSRSCNWPYYIFIFN